MSAIDADTAAPVLKASDYKSDVKPVWCPGCGDFSVLSAITKALAELGIPPHEAVVASGIGCSSRIPAYTTVYGFHSVHGRALPVASGIKLARPELTVLAAGGDGDGFSIGGNHFIHACRRNVDMTYIVMDNAVYGMTKGQASPTTEPDWTASKLTPDGPGISAFQPLEMALSAGAQFIARGFTANPNTLAHLICQAIRHPGFSLVQVLSPCITYRPEQRAYKNRVHQHFGHPEPATDRREAFARLMDDDGFSLGVLYKGSQPVYQPAPAPSATPEEVAAQFAIC
ncbi:2-oxoacid:ferredoxin oxidoreductase subunit beta [Roseospirillum parvum]|uniref:2-oxoglutarate ferredoxin oxidoreductase subunit beta n=1 Tax=Roseospirillum parvum TaxID=83401 RepID=A0A1G7YE70_9PROT|nr:2-oxoacid:ferredoxin oxidoreductase subunit beta [Roseospirillum parvum]SDG94626.1 2-oxoglutarate ferredoxin oxidoreductase subunit beta [Roseospirillum parvum]